jgi:hypothetical protein
MEAGRTPEKDPSDWATGDEPMTGPQASYLQTLSREAGEQFDPSLSKAEASRRIDELQQRTGRGQGSGQGDTAQDARKSGSGGAESYGGDPDAQPSLTAEQVGDQGERDQAEG